MPNFNSLIQEKHLPCSEEPELFFVSEGPESNAFDIARAKAMCGRCPVAAACLQMAFDTDDQWAILGGFTPRERTVIRQRNERAA